ncbi:MULTISPECIES: three component ABC system middle component [Sphingobacterium]|uniref:three component ABC system middle component n=1 Tax=Sphingobacterium TaxID=28453 RepID=UPI00257D59CE|nr:MULTISPECIES: three component ABC system middle component [Sphingobacterium]
MKLISASIINNEALATVALGYFFKITGSLSAAKAILVLPFIFHPPTVRKLRNQSQKRSLEEFILKNPECFFSFNARFIDQLTISINAITILEKMKVITILRDEISFNDNSKFQPENFQRKIGKRASNLLTAIEQLSELMKGQNENSLYLKLKIEL